MVFAETRGKAHSRAMSIFDWAEWNDIAVVRLKEIDKYYKEGKAGMEWDDDDDRIALCKIGWHCLMPDYGECLTCAAHEFCDYYREYCEEMESEWMYAMRGEEDA